MEASRNRQFIHMSEQPNHNLPRDYRTRMRWAVAAALLVHLCLLLLAMEFRHSGPLFVPPIADEQPVIVALQPQDEPKKLIAPGAPANEAPDPSTDLIAERASNAQDMTPGDRGGATPDAGAVGPQDDIVTPPSPPAEVASAPAKANPSETSSAPKRQQDPKDAPLPVAKPAGPSTPAAAPMEQVAKAEPAMPTQADAPHDAAIQLAKAEAPPMPEHTLGKTQTEAPGGVASQGFLSFEAKQSEFAPYLREVRDRVEKRWKALMHVRYSGVSTAQAVVDCAISPDGKLDRVAIIDAGSSATFAGLCKQAIEQAGPFGAFPFQVPAVYQSRNIEIRWTFSFL